LGSHCGSSVRWWNEKINEIKRSRVRSPARQVFGMYTLQCCCHNLACIVIVCTYMKKYSFKNYKKRPTGENSPNLVTPWSGTAKNLEIKLALMTRVARWCIFKPKIQIWVKFGGSCNRRYWNILCLFGLFYDHSVYIFCGHLDYFPPFWYVALIKIWHPCLSLPM
jgi:hypothetical protein